MAIFNLDSVERVMVFGAHPDDEIIGPGATIHKLSSKGKKVCVVTFTCGETAAKDLKSIDEMVVQRKKELEVTNKILGITHREVLDYLPSQQVYSAVYGDHKLHHKLISFIREYKPDLLFTHSEDNHRDHNAINRISRESAFQASEAILEHLGKPHPTPPILYYGVEQEVATPNFIIQVGKNNLQAKLEAMCAQISQTRGNYLRHFEQMITARAQLWGAKIFGADKYAEAFYIEYRTPIKIY